MGVRGLTSFVRSLGVLPSQTEETKTDSKETVSKCNNYRTIEKGCTLAVDGSGLVFYIYRQAYYQHYREVMLLCEQNEQTQSFDDDMHFITNLIPTFLQLHKIKAKTNEILHLLVNKHDLNVKIYLDGSLSRMKQSTQDDRNQKIAAQYSNLRLTFQKEILPPSFRKGQSGNNMNSTSNLTIPTAESLMSDYPIPKLLFDEVLETMDVFSRNHELNASNSRIIELIHCDEEADRYVALQSAADLENTTYAVGSDSDYMLYGFPADIRQSMSFIGDPSVMYIPFEYLSFQADHLVGLVISRSMIASAVGIDEDALLEASIILGNDYTKPFVLDLNFKKTANFFQDTETDEERSRLKPADVIEHLSLLGSDYKVCSEHDLFQLSIDFTRDLYQFKQIDTYPLDIDVSIDIDIDKEGDVGSDHREDDIDSDLTGIQKYDFTPSISAVEEMEKGDTSKQTICHQVLASFQSDHNVHNLLQSTFEFRADYGDDISKHVGESIFPKTASWRFLSMGMICEEAISVTLRQRVLKGEQAYAPSDLFEMSNYLAVCHDSAEEADLNSDEETCDETHDDNKILPIDSHRERIMKEINENRVTIIQAETGAGKSSRLPVFLLEEEGSSVVICQPRRIAAQSLVDRLRSIHPKLRNQVALRMGHGVRKYENKETRAWFMTTGYVVRLLASTCSSFFSKKKITHFIIDEVHERSTETDIVCLLCRRLLESNPKIRLILMSATVSAEMYARYFNVSRPPIFVGSRCFHINEYYLEDLGGHLDLCQRERSEINKLYEKYMNLKCTVPPNAHCMEKIHNLAVQVAVNVAKKGSSVLIFVPGMNDIIAIFERVEKIVKHGINYRCIAIHSDIPFEEQLTAFDSPSDGEIKIIVATNAAESSLTIPCVDHVICSGLCKQITYNSKSHRQMLAATWISRASATQRMGRTGRVREGNVYRLYPRSFFEVHMSAFEVGEMHRVPLDSIILNLRSIMKEEGVSQILEECLEPPDLTAIANSLESLHKSRFIDEVKDDFELTPLGGLVNILGIDLMIAAMIGIANKLDVLAETVAVAAALSFPQSPWLIPNALLQSQTKLNSIVSNTYISKAKFDAGLFSDPFAVVNLLWQYSRSKNKNKFCNDFSLSQPRMRRLVNTYSSLKARVASAIDCEPSSLDIQQPLHLMPSIKLTTLRLIQVWLFHDSIIELNPRSSKKLFIEADGSCSVTLSGDTIEDFHLKSILDTKHHFVLRNESSLNYSGSWKPIDNEGESKEITFSDRIEDKILSLGIERDFDAIILMDSQTTHVLIMKKEQETIQEELQKQSFLFDHFVVCTKVISRTSQRGRYERDCSKWNSQIIGEDELGGFDNDQTKIFMKFTSSLKLKQRSKSFSKLRKNLQQLGINLLCLRLRKGDMNLFDLFLYGGNAGMSEQDISDIFETSKENVCLMKSPNNSGKQQLKFAPDTSYGNDGQRIVHCIPEGMRILAAIASCMRKPILRFETESDTTIEAQLKIMLAQQSWRHLGTNEATLVDGNNIPASVVPIDSTENVRACCTNFLQLRGNMWKADGLTLLPPQENFLSLALRCIGQTSLSIGQRINDEEDVDWDTKMGFADQFYIDFWTNLESNLDYSEEATAFLSSIFDFSSDNPNDDSNSEVKTCKIISSDTSDVFLSNDEDLQMETKSRSKDDQNIDEVKRKKKHRYFCPRCWQQPFKFKTLRNHMKAVHNENLKKKSGWGHEFQMDNIIAFKTLSVDNIEAIVMSNVNITQATGKLKDDQNINEVKRKKKSKKKNKYFCPRCGQKPLGWYSLREHLKTVHNEEIMKACTRNRSRHEFNMKNIKAFKASSADQAAKYGGQKER